LSALSGANIFLQLNNVRKATVGGGDHKRSGRWHWYRDESGSQLGNGFFNHFFDGVERRRFLLLVPRLHDRLLATNRPRRSFEHERLLAFGHAL
jgi:hypothetical protein